MRRPGHLLACLLLIGTVAGACGGGSDDDAPPPQAGPIATNSPPTSAFAASSSTTPMTAPSKSTSTTAPPPTTTTAKPTTTAAPSGDTGPQQFQMPSGNIGCYVSAEDGARCDILEKSWSPPPKPSSCEFDWGNSLGVDSRRAQFYCYSDSVMGASSTLAYGKTSRRGNFECNSAESGVTCRHRPSGHGFFLSRGSYRLF